jgi:hypothetical protein
MAKMLLINTKAVEAAMKLREWESCNAIFTKAFNMNSLYRTHEIDGVHVGYLVQPCLVPLIAMAVHEEYEVVQTSRGFILQAIESLKVVYPGLHIDGTVLMYHGKTYPVKIEHPQANLVVSQAIRWLDLTSMRSGRSNAV